MKKCTHLLIGFVLLCLSFVPNKAKASHAAGGEIIYEWVSDSTYRFFFKFYRDCTGIDKPASTGICFYNPCSNYSYNRTMSLYSGLIPPGNPNGTPVSPGCSQKKTKCDSAASDINGYEEWWYTWTETLRGAPASPSVNAKCDAWRFGVSISARNAQANVGQVQFYVETTFNNLYAGDTNSSPYFSVKPIPFCCLNEPFSYNNGAVDPDGDSLSNEVANPLQNTTCNAGPSLIPFNNASPPYSIPMNPLQTNNSFVISATTGQMNFTPTATGNYTLTNRTKEWRNGVQIGSIMRDVQVQVISPCSQVPTYQVPNTALNVTGGIWSGTEVETCIEQPVSFKFSVSSTEPDAILIMGDNIINAFPATNQPTTSYAGQRTTSVTGTFNWTPLATQSGLYTLSVTYQDSTCRPPGILYSNTYTIPIKVWANPDGLGDTSICPGDQAQLSAINGKDFSWTVVGGPPTSLPGGTSPAVGTTIIVNPRATTTYLVTSTGTPFCTVKTATVTVTALPIPEFTPMLDDTTCPGVPVLLDPKIGGATPTPGVQYDGTWTPATYLTSTYGLTTTTNPGGDIDYVVTIGASNTQCVVFDTVHIEVVDGFIINNADGAICVGSTVQIDGSGDTRYNFLWETTDPQGILVFSDPYKIDPLITPSTIVGEYNYTLHAMYPGCPDSIGQITIDVQPIPTVQINEDAIVCFGDTMQLDAIVNPPGYSKYIYSWTPASALDKPNVTNPIFAGIIVGENTIVFSTKTNGANCEDKDTIVLNVLPSDFMFLSADTAICPGDSINVHMTGVGLKSFYWAKNDALNDVMSADPLVWPSTTNDYVVYGRDTNMCYDTASVRVTVRPRAIVEIPDSIRIYPGQSYQILPSGNATRYSWFPPVGLNRADIANPVASPQVNTRYTVTAVTEGNCIATDAIDVIVTNETFVDMPNAFTPGNSPRSWLKPVKLGDARLKTFVVYNRWGVKMFETADISEGWDGRYGGQSQPMGVYIYTVDAVTPSGKTISKQGNVTLIR